MCVDVYIHPHLNTYNAYFKIFTHNNCSVYSFIYYQSYILETNIHKTHFVLRGSLVCKYKAMKNNKIEGNENNTKIKTPEVTLKNTANKMPKDYKDIIKENPKIDFDTLLPFAGEFGLYQFLIFLSTMPFYAYGVFVYFSQIFITEVSPNHWCWIPELENLTAMERRNLTIPTDENSRFGYSQCTSYVANWSEVLKTGERPNSDWKVAPCENG